jgi:hypothetical protein
MKAEYSIGERVVVRVNGEPDEVGRITQRRQDVYGIKLESGPLVWVTDGYIRRLPQARRWRA